MEKSYHPALPGKDPAKIEQTETGEATAVMMTYKHQASSFYDEDKDEDRKRKGNHTPKHPDPTQSPSDGLGEKPKSMIQQPSVVATTSTTSPQSLVPQNQVGILVGPADAFKQLADATYSYHSGKADKFGQDGKTLTTTITTFDANGKKMETTKKAEVRVVITKKQLGAEVGKAVIAAGASLLSSSFKWTVQGALKTAFIEIYAIPLVNSVVDILFSEVPAIITQHAITEPLNVLIDLVNTEADMVNLLAQFGYNGDTRIRYKMDLDKSNYNLWRLAMFFGFTKNPILNFFNHKYQLVGRMIGSIVHDIFLTIFNRIKNFVIFKNCAKRVAAFAFRAMKIVLQKIRKFYESDKKFKDDLRKAYDENLKPCMPKMTLEAANNIYEHISNTYTDLANTLSVFKVAMFDNTSSAKRSIIESIVGIVAKQQTAYNDRQRDSQKATRKPKSRMMGPQPQGGDGESGISPEVRELGRAQTSLFNCTVGNLLLEEGHNIQFFPKEAGVDLISKEDAFEEMDILQEAIVFEKRPSYNTAPTTFKDFLEKGYPTRVVPLGEGEEDRYEGNDRLKEYPTDLDLLKEAAYDDLLIYSNRIVPLGGDQAEGVKDDSAWDMMTEKFAEEIFDVPPKRNLDDIFTFTDPDSETEIMKAAAETWAKFLAGQKAQEKRREDKERKLQEKKKGTFQWFINGLDVSPRRQDL